jgi:hypothetical protein
MTRDTPDQHEIHSRLLFRRAVTNAWQRACAEEPNKPRHILAREVYQAIKSDFRQREIEAFRILRELQGTVNFLSKEEEDNR